MKKLFMLLSLGMLVAGATFAQEAPKNYRKPRTEQARNEGVQEEEKTPEQRAAKRSAMLTKKYNLNQAQQTRLQALYLRQANETSTLHAQRGGADVEKGQLREALKAKRAQWDAELQSILTKEQYAQYQADQKERASKTRERVGRKGQSGNGKEQKKEQRS
jgi:Spy/CpxP family protein refolding chaperone